MDYVYQVSYNRWFNDYLRFFFSAKGKAPSRASGFLTSIYSRIQELHQGQEFTICIETESNNIFVSKQDDITIGVYKMP